MKAQTLFISRYILAGTFAVIVVFGLFWVMQHLINIADRKLDEDNPGQILEIVRVPPEEPVIRPEPPPKPPLPDQTPPEPPPPSTDKVAPETGGILVSVPPVNPPVVKPGAGGFGLTPSEGDQLPIVKVQPVYPRRAQERGIEGYVIVEFTVTKSGATRDIRVVETVPPGIFDKASLAAAAKFKYKPRVVDGQPIESPGVQNKFTFELEE